MDAVDRAVRLGPSEIDRETGYPLGSVLRSLISRVVAGLETPTPIFASTGLDFIRPNVVTEAAWLVNIGLARACTASERPTLDRDHEVERAAGEIAQGVALLVRRVLESIVETRVDSEAASELIRQISESTLGPSFAAWLQQNWRDLLQDPRFRTKPRGGVSSSPDIGRIAPEPRRARAPATQPPPADPVTFGSNVSAAAQAATLAAAAASGKPFCPE